MFGSVVGCSLLFFRWRVGVICVGAVAFGLCAVDVRVVVVAVCVLLFGCCFVVGWVLAG